MEKKYLKGSSPREKRLFYYHQLLTNIQEIKIPILIITLGVALFEVIQFFTMPSELRTSSRKRVYITIVCCILASLCYLIAIFRRINENIRRNLLINYSDWGPILVLDRPCLGLSWTKTSWVFLSWGRPGTVLSWKKVFWSEELYDKLYIFIILSSGKTDLYVGWPYWMNFRKENLIFFFMP